MIKAKQIRVMVPVSDAYAAEFENDNTPEWIRPRVMEAYLHHLFKFKSIPGLHGTPKFVRLETGKVTDPETGMVIYDSGQQEGKIAVFEGYGYRPEVEGDLETHAEIVKRTKWFTEWTNE